MELFEALDCIFSKTNWSKVSVSDKNKHYFMIMRFISIKFPMEAEKFNVNGVNKVATLNHWNFILSMKFINTPQWIRTVTIKSKDIEDFKFPQKTINQYLKINKISQKDFDFLKKTFYEELKTELKELEKQIKEFGEDYLS
jgi:hypothetical protein